MSDEEYMRIAIEEAKQAESEGEVPVGAIVVDEEGEVISRSHNLREATHMPSAHAEHSAIERAAEKLDSWRLTGCTVYVTLEPCMMCAGLMTQARIKRCVFGASDRKAGALETLYEVGSDKRLNHNFEVTSGVLGQQCADLLINFFKERRSKEVSKPFEESFFARMTM